MKPLIILEMATNHSGDVQHGKKLLIHMQKFVININHTLNSYLNFNIEI